MTTLPDIRRLKRGLGNISSFFHSKPDSDDGECPVRSAVSLSRVCMCICDPVHPEYHSRLAGLAAAQLKGAGRLSVFADIRDRHDLGAGKACQGLGSLTLAMDELSPVHLWDSVMKLHKADLDKDYGVILQCDFNAFEDVSAAVDVMEQLVLVLRPDPDSVHESYRLLKRISSYRKTIDYGVIVACDLQEGSGGEQLFEKFSSLVSKHLGVRLNWLGSIQGQRISEGLLDIHVDFNQLLTASAQRPMENMLMQKKSPHLKAS